MMLAAAIQVKPMVIVALPLILPKIKNQVS